jgi:hypothetical protein
MTALALAFGLALGVAVERHRPCGTRWSHCDRARLVSTDYRDAAACDPSTARLFDPISDEDRYRGGDGGVMRFREARAICRRCPVQAECLNDGTRNRRSGVYGGLLLESGRPTRMPMGYRTTAVTLAADRPIESYYGPAAPEVIAELIDALDPPASHAVGARARWSA